MLQSRLEIYFSQKTSQICRKCHMYITFYWKQILSITLYLLPLQIWLIMMQMYKFMIQPNTLKFIVLLFALKANTSKLHAKNLFWYPGETRANTTAN